MVYLQKPPGGRFATIEELEEHDRFIESLRVRSYDEYISKGHEWCWCLVGNIIEEHEFGEEKEMKQGTKHFTKGTKVCLAPIQWGMATKGPL